MVCRMKKRQQKYINREISWLSFNERVLQEADDPTTPLIERIKFLGIFSSNLDEFFRVRVGTLKRIVDAGLLGKVGHVGICCYYHMRANGNPPVQPVPDFLAPKRTPARSPQPGRNDW